MAWHGGGVVGGRGFLGQDNATTAAGAAVLFCHLVPKPFTKTVNMTPDSWQAATMALAAALRAAMGHRLDTFNAAYAQQARSVSVLVRRQASKAGAFLGGGGIDLA
jgi:hypothetical protein